MHPVTLNCHREPGGVNGQRTVPCGQCIECRLKRKRHWGLRCMHEASLYDANSFVTLTVDQEHLFRPYVRPWKGRLQKTGSLDGPVPGVKRGVFPLFMDVLRKVYGSVRYFHAGEYGEEDGRPHYHALLFGLQFRDKRQVGVSDGGYPVFESAGLSALWKHGRSTIGDVTFDSAQYVAGYCVKKVTGSRAEAHYRRTGVHGEVIQLEPEYATMSRRPGIGAAWYEQYREEVYRADSVIRGGHEMSPPRYYDKKEAERDEARMEVIKARRIRKRGPRFREGESSWLQNAAREQIAVARLRQLEEQRR